MVNFTCNTCGDSLKKKDVTTHFARKIKCRQAASLTCFDCLKVFGQDFVGHTVCITEDQRYSANGLSGVEKNKTQVWSESIHRHLGSVLADKGSSLSNSVKSIIEHVLNVPSVPRKEKAFFNFVRNLKKFVEPDIRTVWNIVSEFSKQQENQPQANGAPQNKNNPKKSEANGITTSNGTDSSKKSKVVEKAAGEIEKNNEDVSKEGKKKKKSKKSDDLTEGMEDMDISTDLNESGKQKKKKQKSESVDTSQTNGNSEETPMEAEEQNVESEKLSKKEKKLKKKKEKFEAEIKAVVAEKTNEGDMEDVDEPVVDEKEKKKKKKHAAEADDDVEMDKEKKKKNKKRERTVSMLAEADQPLKKNKSKNSDENAEPNEEVDVPAPRKDFNWADVIVQVLQSQNGNEMSVKRLCKKVVNEYLTTLLDGAHVDELKATAKFQKKLQKTPGVFVHKDKARLKSAD